MSLGAECMGGDAADQLQCMADALDTLEVSTNTFWLLFGAALVFFMQTGFAMLEVGCVSWKNAKNILVKNVFDASLGAIMWYLTGYGIAMGADDYASDGRNGFMGTTGFVLSGATFRGSADQTVEIGYNWAGWLFQWAFAATTATIVSGAVVERVTFGAYLIYAVCLIGFIYPTVVHWGWGQGWASAFHDPADRLVAGCGLLDFAGSGVVHMTGGMAALVGAYMLGPRVGRFRDGQAIEMPQLSFVYQTLGTLCLWFGWYGFNGVSSLYIIGKGEVAARAMVNTTIAAACGCVSSVVMSKFMVGYINPEAANNGILGGLVAITAGCAVVNPEGAIAIGLIAGVIYNASSSLLLRLQIDDVVDAAPVHYFCGIWGVLSAALFATKSGYANAYYPDRSDQCCGAFYGCGGDQFAANLAFVVANSAWTGVLSFFMYLTAKYTVGLRVSAEVEEIGMDASKHGGIMSYAAGGLDGSRKVGGEGVPNSLFPPGAHVIQMPTDHHAQEAKDAADKDVV